MPVTGYDGKNKTSAENKRFGPMSFDNHINNVTCVISIVSSFTTFKV